MHYSKIYMKKIKDILIYNYNIIIIIVKMYKFFSLIVKFISFTIK